MLWGLLVVFTVLALPTHGVADTTGERTTLAGIKGIAVLLEQLDDEGKRLVTEDSLRTDVELRLRQAGIEVLDIRDASWWLYVNLAALQSRVRQTQFAYALHADIKETMLYTKVSNPKLAAAVLRLPADWSTPSLGQPAPDPERSREPRP